MNRRNLIAAAGTAALLALAAVTTVNVAERLQADPAQAPTVDAPTAPALEGLEPRTEQIELPALQPRPSPLGPVRSWDPPRWLTVALHVPARPARVDAPRAPTRATAADLTEKLVPSPLAPVGLPALVAPVSRWRLAAPHSVASAFGLGAC